MHVDRKAARVGLAVGLFGALANAGMVALLFWVHPAVLQAPTGLPGVGKWFSVVAWTGVVLTYGTMLVAAVGAFAVAFPEERTAGPVLAGFVPGSLLYGLGVTLANLTTTTSLAANLAEYLRMGGWLAVAFVGLAALGALGADTVGPLFRTPEGTDEGHPRW